MVGTVILKKKKKKKKKKNWGGRSRHIKVSEKKKGKKKKKKKKKLNETPAHLDAISHSFGYKRSRGSENIIWTKFEQTDRRADRQTDTQNHGKSVTVILM